MLVGKVAVVQQNARVQKTNGCVERSTPGEIYRSDIREAIPFEVRDIRGVARIERACLARYEGNALFATSAQNGPPSVSDHDAGKVVNVEDRVRRSVFCGDQHIKTVRQGLNGDATT